MGLFNNIKPQDEPKEKRVKVKKITKKREDKTKYKTTKYGVENIKVLKGLDGVRLRPSMYIGDTDKRGLHHLVHEILDNSVDEALAGFCNKIIITLHSDSSVEIEDNGRGIPSDIHPEAKISGLELVMTTLHAGGKFDGKSYFVSGGLHGVGASVVNALSEYLEATVYRDKKEYYQRYEFGKPVTKVIIKDISNTKTGTKIKFKPDKTIFKTTQFDYDKIAERVREVSFLIPNISIKLIQNKRVNEFISRGLLDFLSYINRNKKQIIDNHFAIYDKYENIDINIVLNYTNEQDENIISFVNTIPTVDGGYHVTGLRTGLSKAFAKYIKENQIKEKIEITGDDLREGLSCIIHIKLPNPQFEGQTKTKLGNSEIKGIVESIVFDKFFKWLENNAESAQTIIKKAIIAAQGREAARRAKELVRRKSSLVDSDVLPGKLADCLTKKPSKSELWIVEGESAAGTMKGARDRHTQAILPLRGKILNVEKSNLNKLLQNTEIKTIFSAIGAGMGDECNVGLARYHKIIIATDADSDGAHIATLLLTLFYKYMKCLIEAGFIYISIPPLYRVKIGNKIWYIANTCELEKIQNKYKDKNIEIQRFKGLGEMNSDQLWETTMDPNNRILKQITIDDAKMAEKMLSILMGVSVEKRKKFLLENAKNATNIDI